MANEANRRGFVTFYTCACVYNTSVLIMLKKHVDVFRINSSPPSIRFNTIIVRILLARSNIRSLLTKPRCERIDFVSNSSDFKTGQGTNGKYERTTTVWSRPTLPALVLKRHLTNLRIYGFTSDSTIGSLRFHPKYFRSCQIRCDLCAPITREI